MDLIASFTIDHLNLEPGIYVSRRDEIGNRFVTTFDLRMKRPNRESVIHQGAMHTIEHIVATFLRNSEAKDSIVYFGPMGCLTGCYLLVNTPHKIEGEELAPLIRRAFEYLANFEGEVPGARAVECGNYLLHDLPMAKLEARAFLSQQWHYKYPEVKTNA